MNDSRNRSPVYMTVLRVMVFAYDVLVASIFVPFGIENIATPMQADTLLAFDCGVVHLATGLAAITAGVLLLVLRPPKWPKVGVVTHGVTVVALGLSSWYMSRVAAVAASRPRGHMEMLNPGAVETLAVWFFVGLAVVSLIATLVLLALVSVQHTTLKTPSVNQELQRTS